MEGAQLHWHELTRGSATLSPGERGGTEKGWKQNMEDIHRTVHGGNRRGYFIEPGLQTQAFPKHKDKFPPGHSPSSPRLNEMQRAGPGRTNSLRESGPKYLQ